MIEGVITDLVPKGKYDIELETYGILGFVYASYMDSSPKLYLKTLPSFNECVDYFLHASAPFLKINKRQDICLSLFYNPYFNELYTIVKEQGRQFPKGRKKFLIKYLLSYLADPIWLKLTFVDEIREHFLKYNSFNRSQEMIEILKKQI